MDGFFVEVGCIDGRRFSNTLTFEQRGWKGLCVEAHGDYIDLLKQNRPNSTICHCAAAEVDEDAATFYANKRGSLSTLDKSQEDMFAKAHGHYFTGFVEQQVSKRRLDTLFHEHNIRHIDVLSLDIEGYEVEALQGLDMSWVKPKVLLIESETREHQRKLDRLLLPLGYIKSVKVASNRFYVLEKQMDRCLRGRVMTCQLIHTGNPLDQDPDETLLTQIDTCCILFRPRKIGKRIMRLLYAISYLCRRILHHIARAFTTLLAMDRPKR